MSGDDLSIGFDSSALASGVTKAVAELEKLETALRSAGKAEVADQFGASIEALETKIRAARNAVATEVEGVNAALARLGAGGRISDLGLDPQAIKATVDRSLAELRTGVAEINRQAAGLLGDTYSRELRASSEQVLRSTGQELDGLVARARASVSRGRSLFPASAVDVGRQVDQGLSGAAIASTAARAPDTFEAARIAGLQRQLAEQFSVAQKRLTDRSLSESFGATISGAQNARSGALVQGQISESFEAARNSLSSLRGLSPATEQLILAEREAAAALRADIRETRLLGAGGGRGGRGAGGGVGAAAASGPADAFFGSLTSRGFGGNSQRGDVLNNLAAGFGSAVKYTALYSAIGAGTQVVGAAKAQIVDYIDSLTDAATALDNGTGSFQHYRSEIDQNVVPSLEKLSRLTGSNVGESLDAFTRGVRAFSDTDQPATARSQTGIDFAKQATQLSVITGGDLKDKTGDLIAIGSAFGYTGKQLDSVTDAIANARQSGGDLNQISQGLANFAAVANEVGLNAQQAANLISVVQAKTDQSGQAVATHVAKITQIFGTRGNQTLLQGLGIDTSQGFLEQVRDLNTALQKVSPEERSAVTSKLAGPTNAKEFTVLMGAADDIIKKSDADLRNAGAGATLFGQKNSDLAGLFRKINGDINNIIINFQRSDIGAPLGIALTLFEKVLKVAADLTGILAGLPHILTGTVFTLGEVYGVLKLSMALLDRFRGAGAARAGGAALSGVAGSVLLGQEIPRTSAEYKVPSSPSIAANIAAIREKTAAELEGLKVSEQVAIGDLAVARTEQTAATATLARARADLEAAEAGGLNVAALEAKRDALRRITLAERELLVLDEALVGADRQYNEVIAQRNLLVKTATTEINAQNAANVEALRIEQELNASRATGVVEGAGARRGIAGRAGGFLTSGKGIGAVLAASAGIELAGSFTDNINRRRESDVGGRDALGAIGAAKSNTDLQNAIQQARESAQKTRDSSQGFFGGTIDTLSHLFGNQSAGDRADLIQSQADKSQTELDQRKKAEQAAAAAAATGRLGDSADLFRDRTVDGLKASFDLLSQSGTSAQRVLDLVAKSFDKIDAPPGTFKPGQRAGFVTAAIGEFAGGAKSDDLVAAVANIFGQTGQPGVPRDPHARAQDLTAGSGIGLLGGLFNAAPGGSSLLDKLGLGKLVPNGPFGSRSDPELEAAAKLVDPENIAKQQAALANNPAGQDRFNKQVADARNKIAQKFLERVLDPQKLTSVQDTVSNTVNDFLNKAGVSDKGGVLDPTQQAGLADAVSKAVDGVLKDSGLSPEQRALLVKALKDAAVKQYGAALGGQGGEALTQDAENFNAQQEAASIANLGGNLKVGNAQRIADAQANISDLQKQRSAPGADLASIDAQIAEARRSEADAGKAESATDILKQQLAQNHSAQQRALDAGLSIPTVLIQQQLELQQQLADSTLADRNLDIDLQVDPRSSQGKATGNLQKAAATLEDARTRFGENSNEFKKALIEFGNVQLAFAQLAVQAANAAAEATLRPGDSLGRAAQQLQGLRAQQSLTIPGSIEYNQFQAQINQAQYSQAQGSVAADASKRAVFSAPGQLSDARNSLGNAQEQLGLALQFGGEKEYYDALKGIRDAQIQLAQAELTRVQSARQAGAFPGAEFQNAAVGLQNATDAVNQAAQIYGTNSTEFFQAMTAYHQALESFAQAQDQAVVNRYKLSSGLNDPIVNASADLYLAQSKLSRLQQAGAPQQDQVAAQLQIRQAQFAQAQAFADRDSAKRALGVTPGSNLGSSIVALADAKQAVDIASQYSGTDSAAYYKALGDLKKAQFDLASAERDAAKTSFLLGQDITDPLVQATADVRQAQQKLQDDLNGGASSDVLNNDRLALQTSQANQESTAFSQRLQAAQTADQLGRISHAQYIQYLENEKTRLEAVSNRTYQQQQELDQVDTALKSVRDQFSGQFNLGDIKVPTPYEVRRYIAAQTGIPSVAGGYISPGSPYAGSSSSLPFGDSPLNLGAPTSGSAGSTNTTTIYFQVNGADVGMVTSLINQAIGGTLPNYTNAPKKV